VLQRLLSLVHSVITRVSAPSRVLEEGDRLVSCTGAFVGSFLLSCSGIVLGIILLVTRRGRANDPAVGEAAR